MSRNFELLQNLGKEQLVVDDLAPVESTPEREISEPFNLTEPQLKLDPSEHEQLTKLVQRVFLVPAEESPRIVVFTASESGNGCSWICARAAEALAAQVAGNVCLVDANFRKPELHSQFGLDNQEGLADALCRQEPVRNFIRQLSRPNLWLLSSGSSPERCVSSLGSEHLRRKLAELRSPNNYVLIDAPAMNVSSDGAALGAGADGVVIVFRANTSRREPARKVIQDLRVARVRVLGAVLNQRTFPIPESIYKRI